MEEKDDAIHADYLKGFNEGYTLAQQLPELAKSIAAAAGDTERGRGLKDGRSQYEIEKSMDKYPDWLKDIDPFRTDKDMDKEMDKDKDLDDLDMTRE